MDAKKRKKPSDYEQFYCRMSASEKEEIERLLSKVCGYAKKTRKDGELLIRRNDFIVKILKLGLNAQLRKFEEAVAKKKN